MKLIIVSGRSGAGKGTALHILEDLGYFCIDNLPAALLPELVAQTAATSGNGTRQMAVSIDARNFPDQLQRFPQIISELKQRDVHCEVVYLDANDRALIKRFSETRRRHPLSLEDAPLPEALQQEHLLLGPMADIADLTIDTSELTLHQLRDIIRTRVAHSEHRMSLQFESFGFKNGVPVDADLVFDIRCLPNPHWDPGLRAMSGRDRPVQEFLEAKSQVNEMFQDIVSFMDKWLPHFLENNRSYMTVAIGCTGGKHRSVYLSERLGTYYAAKLDFVQVRHRELGNA